MGYGTDGLTFNDLRDANAHRCNNTRRFERCKKWIGAQWINAAQSELGEAGNIIKKLDRGDHEMTLDHTQEHPNPDDIEAGMIEHLAEELADAVTYIDLLALHYGIDLGSVVMEKFNKVSERVDSNVRLEAGRWYFDSSGYNFLTPLPEETFQRINEARKRMEADDSEDEDIDPTKCPF